MATATPPCLRRFRGILAVAALTLLPLAGCSDQSEPLPTAAGPQATPTALATPSATVVPPTPTPTHTAEPPRMAVPPWPKHAKEPTAEGAKAAAMYYLEDLHYYMGLTGDTAPYAQVCPPELDFCAFFIDGAKALRDSGRHGFGGDIEFVEVKAVPKPGGRDVVVSAICSVAPTPIYHNDGRPDVVAPAARFRIDATVRYSSERWVFTSVAMEEAP